jgi:hypothetical protein
VKKKNAIVCSTRSKNFIQIFYQGHFVFKNRIWDPKSKILTENLKEIKTKAVQLLATTKKLDLQNSFFI